MIVSEPSDQVAPLGGSARFSVTVQSGTPVTYRWYANGTLLTGEETSTLAVPNVHWADRGRYVVVAQNAAGAVMSNPALLTITNVPIRIAAAGVEPQGFSLKLGGPLSSRYVIESGSDCASWQPVYTNTAMDGSLWFTDSEANLCPTRVYRALLLESLLERNPMGKDQEALKKGSLAAQSFKQGTVGGPDYWIRRLVVYVPTPGTNQGPALTVGLGTGLGSPALPGSSVTVIPASIADTNVTPFAPVIIRFPQPVGPLASGTAYYINMTCDSANDGSPIVLAGSLTNVYAGGAYYRDGIDRGGDLRFEIWGN